MASFLNLKDKNLNSEISNRQLETVSETRLLGKKFSDVKDVANASYGILRTLRKLKLTFYRLPPSVRDFQSRLYYRLQDWTVVTRSIHLCQDTC